MATKTRKEVDRELTETFGFVPNFTRAIPESAAGPMWDFQHEFEFGETAIPNKYKELIGLAMAAHIKCKYCIYFHTKNAKIFGATDEELREAILMGGLTVAYSNQITGMQTDYEQFKVDVDRALTYVAQHSGEAHPH